MKDYQKVAMVNINPVKDIDTPLNLIKSGRVSIIGSPIFGSREALLKLNKLFHQSIQYLHSINVADDDQAVYIYIYRKNNIIKLYHNDLSHPSGWFRGFLMFHCETSSNS